MGTGYAVVFAKKPMSLIFIGTNTVTLDDIVKITKTHDHTRYIPGQMCIYIFQYAVKTTAGEKAP